MSEQLQDKCSICGGYMFSDDDIVYCPDCGAPHHRDCWNSVGHCGLKELHGTDKQYTKAENKTELNAKRCADCGRVLPNDSKFCPFCGWNAGENPPTREEFLSFNLGNSQIKIDTYGGVDKNSDIDGVKVKDIAKFILFAPNSIVPKLKQLGGKRRISWNWIAFITPFSHALFRKMNGAFFMYLLLEITGYVLLTPYYNLVLSANLPINYTSAQLAEYIADNITSFMQPAPIILALLGSLLLIGMRIYAGMFNDWHYKNHITSTIKAIRANPEKDDDEEFHKKGGVRPFLSMLVFISSTYFGALIPSILNNFFI